MHDRSARLDRAADEQVHPAADDAALAAPLEPEVGRDRDDAAVLLGAAPDELGEHADLAGGPVVDHRAVQPGDERIRRAKAAGIDSIDVFERHVGEAGEVLVRNEAVEPFRAQARGERVEPDSLGFGEERAGEVEAH